MADRRPRFVCGRCGLATRHLPGFQPSTWLPPGWSREAAELRCGTCSPTSESADTEVSEDRAKSESPDTDLSTDRKAIAVDALPALEEEARKRSEANLLRGNERPSESPDSVGTDRKPNRSYREAANKGDEPPSVSPDSNGTHLIQNRNLQHLRREASGAGGPGTDSTPPRVGATPRRDSARRGQRPLSGVRRDEPARAPKSGERARAGESFQTTHPKE